MLKLEYLKENYGLAKYCLLHYEYDELSLNDMLKYFRISSNAIYPYKNKGKVCLLRISPVIEKSKKNLLGELHFIEYLLESGFSAVECIKSKRGKQLLALATPFGEYYVSAFKFVSGEQVSRLKLDDEIIFECGRTLGKLHKLSSNYRPRHKKWTHVDCLEWSKKVFTECHAPNIAYVEWERVYSLIDELSKDKQNYGLLHYDFEVDNLFYDKDLNQINVIDFEDGIYCWYRLDVLIALESLCQQVDSSQISHLKEVFIKGYMTEYFYEENQQEADILLRFSKIYKYARILHALSSKEDDNEILKNIRQKLNEYLRKEEGEFIKY